MQGKQRGSVLIVALWTITLLTILVAALASQTRLSARVAWFQQQDLRDWANISAALNQAEMDLMLARMAEPIKRTDNPEELNKNSRYRFNGDDLELYYPQAEDIKVRIYEHAGKINLSEISRPMLRALLEKQLGQDDKERIDAMISAWTDWLDLNDQTGINGAEKDYYLELDPPYEPRNAPLETVEEILLIKGFAEVFKDIDLDAAFTLYGEREQINLNLATIEAMRLLPGLNDELIEAIVAWRRENEFRGNGDVVQIVPAENMALLRPWLDSRGSSSFYTIMVYKQSQEPDAENTDSYQSTAFAETVEISPGNGRPLIHKVNPYQPLPLRFELSNVE